MKKIVIADITTLTDGESIYGHFAKVAEQYYGILSQSCEVKIAGGCTYRRYFDERDLYELPYWIDVKSNYSGIKGKIGRKVKEFLNARKALQADADAIIFQCLNETPIFLALLFGKTTNVFMIQYQKGLNSRGKRLLYRIVKHKITGVIASSEEVGDFYGVDYRVLPDYFPTDESDKCIRPQYDVIAVGTINDWKNYDDVVRSFTDTECSVLIAGKFRDQDYYQRLRDAASDNIVIKNEYLSDEEYMDYLQSGRYVLLPYREQYSGKSSGVMLEALYCGQPIIAPRLDTFDVACKMGCGLFYEKSVAEIVDFIRDVDKHSKCKANAMVFTSRMQNKKRELTEFVTDSNR